MLAFSAHLKPTTFIRTVESSSLLCDFLLFIRWIEPGSELTVICDERL